MSKSPGWLRRPSRGPCHRNTHFPGTAPAAAGAGGMPPHTHTAQAWGTQARDRHLSPLRPGAGARACSPRTRTSMGEGASRLRASPQQAPPPQSCLSPPPPQKGRGSWARTRSGPGLSRAWWGCSGCPVARSRVWVGGSRCWGAQQRAREHGGTMEHAPLLGPDPRCILAGAERDVGPAARSRQRELRLPLPPAPSPAGS